MKQASMTNCLAKKDDDLFPHRDEGLAELYPCRDDLLYEEEILRNPFSLKLWWQYLVARANAPLKKRWVIYERALKALPGSYKLWHAYLRERLLAVAPLPITHPLYNSLNNTFERALVTMHKMPRIWIIYLTSLTDQRLLTRARRAFDRALLALPITHHARIWPPYLALVSLTGIPVETSLRVHRRYLLFDPSHMDTFIDFLLASARWQDAAECLAAALNDETFHSVRGKTRHQLWLDLCNLLTRHANDISLLNVDAIIRGGLRKCTAQAARLWTALAYYYTRQGLYEMARDIFEEALTTVVTVCDFGVVFDAYYQFEYTALSAKMEDHNKSRDNEVEDCNKYKGDREDHDDGCRRDILPESVHKHYLDGFFWLGDDDDVDLRLARLEYIIDRRPELVNSLLLRQNPHNVENWHRRVKLFGGNPSKQILTYTEAVKSVDPTKAVGKPHTLWVSFAHLYENHTDLVNAREIFGRAVQVNFKTVDHLACVWCEWAEMELRHKNFKGALELMRQATAEPSVEVKRRVAAYANEPVQMKLHRSLRLWSFYVDLEESLGTLESTRAVYERILDLQMVTPQIILNYAFFLEEQKYFEDAFKVYERGIQIFKYPHAKDIWVAYLSKFVKRYGRTKLERARELFECAVEKAPAEHVKPLYLQYAELEEDYGLAKRSMEVYDRAVKAVPKSEQLSMYAIYIARAAEIFGVPMTRQIYEQAIESGLPDRDVKTMRLEYVKLERSLGEIDRARAIFVRASPFADPRSDPSFWEIWNEFEVQHGNEKTFRDMRWLSRSVSASYNQTHSILPQYSKQKDGNLKRARKPEDEVDALERQSAPASVSLPQDDGNRMVIKNNEDIDLPEESNSEDEKVEIDQKDVPAAVLCDLACQVMKEKHVSLSSQEDNRGNDPFGALERIKRLRRK